MSEWLIGFLVGWFAHTFWRWFIVKMGWKKP